MRPFNAVAIHSRLNRRAKGFSFSRGRITAGRPELHHFGGHNPIASQPAFNAALANFATVRIALAYWRETIRAAAPDLELGGDIGGNPRMGRNLA